MGGTSSSQKRADKAETMFADFDFSLQDVARPAQVRQGTVATHCHPPRRTGQLHNRGTAQAGGRPAVLYGLLGAKDDSVFGVVPASLVVQLPTIQFPKGTETNFDDLKCPLPGLSAAQKLLCQGTPDSFEMQPPQMLLLFFIMLQELGLFSALEIPPAKMQHLFTDIHNGYRKNPYHNFNHAFETCQIGFACLMGFPHRELLDPLLLMGFMLASLGHDIDHPGYSNNFLIQTKDPIAILFHNRSVLENSHSAAIALMLSYRPDSDICENLTEEEKKFMIEAIVDFVLATDMFLHDVVLKEFASLDVLAEAKTGGLAKRTQLDVLRMVIKVADLGHVIQPFPQAKRWDDSLMEEFFAEGDKDREQGRTPIDMHNRDTANGNKTSHWFYKHMCKPLVEAYKVCSPVHGAKLVSALDQNVVDLGNLLEKDGNAQDVHTPRERKAASVYGMNRPEKPVHFNMIRDNAKELVRSFSATGSSSSIASSHPPESPGKVTKVPSKTSPSKLPKDKGGGGNVIKRRKSRFA